MKLIDNIKAGEIYFMTVELKKEFKAAGCVPTRCHACNCLIKVNDQFQLITHKKEVFVKNGFNGRSYPITKTLKISEDEMCCKKCTVLDLHRRDLLLAREKGKISKNFIGGFSRPSKLIDIETY